LKDKYISINDQRYFFVSHDKRKYVIPDKCPHKGAPLSLGRICEIKKVIQCPWHDNTFKTCVLIKQSITGVRVHKKLFYF